VKTTPRIASSSLLVDARSAAYAFLRRGDIAAFPLFAGEFAGKPLFWRRIRPGNRLESQENMAIPLSRRTAEFQAANRGIFAPNRGIDLGSRL
jgi:hypothetical protein